MREVPVPGLRGQPAQAGVARGHPGRPRLGGKNIAEVCALPIGEAADFLRHGRARARASGRSPSGCSRRSTSGSASCSTSASTTSPSTGPAGTLVRRRGAAHPAGHPDRLRPGRRPLRPRRAVDRPAPARQPPADRDPGPAPGPRQHPDRRRARRGHHPHRRLGRRHRPRRRRARRPGRRTPARVEDLLDHRDSLTGAYLSGRREIPMPAVRRPRDARPRAHRQRAPRAQPARRRRRASRSGCSSRSPACPARASRRWSTTSSTPSLAKQIYNARAGARPAHQTITGLEHVDKVDPRRPVADRPHAAVQPGDLHRRLRPHPQALRRDARGEDARLPPGPVLVQRQGRPLRGVLRRRHDQDRDELPARTSTSRARSATAPATTARRSRCTTRARPSPRSSTCRSRRPPTSSRRSRRSPGT